MLSILLSQANAKTVSSRSAISKLILSQSIPELSSLSLGSSVYIVSFLLTVIQSTDHFSNCCMQTHSHIHCTPFLSLVPLPFFLCHTHINSAPPPPPPPPQISPAPCTPNHSLPLTKTLGKHQRPHHSRGGLKTATENPHWQKAMNETERMAEFQMQENCNVPGL